MSYRAIVLHTDGTSSIELIENKYDGYYHDISELVNGYLEILYESNDIVIYINEEGKLTNLPKNKWGILLNMRGLSNVSDIRGDIVIVGAGELPLELNDSVYNMFSSIQQFKIVSNNFV